MNAPPKRTVLVVDDSADDRAMIRRLLAKQSREYLILEADTGDAGLEMVRKEQPDCVLTDFYLPDMDGNDFLDALKRQVRGGLPLPVAVLTGEQSDEIAAEALSRGAQDYLAKDGLSSTALARGIENAIEKFQIQRELMESRMAIELRNHKLEVLRDQLQEKVSELDAATRAKDQFMAVMSHEMRTPLNAIIGYSDLLEMELDGTLTPGQREQVKRIQVGGRHLLELINDVLDLARADANKLDVELQAVHLGAVLEEVVSLLENQAAEKNIELVLEPHQGEWPRVRADLRRLRQILTNLIGNALKFTSEGSVRVRCETDADGRVRVHVTDTGIGIDPQILPRVFTDFYQVRGELTREKGGSGLGLAIAQRLARLMGGEILAESMPGEGSTFTLVLLPARSASTPRRSDLDHAAAVQARDTRSERRMSERRRAARSQPVSVVAFGSDELALAELQRRVEPGVRLRWTTQVEHVASLAVEEHAALIVLDIGNGEAAVWRAAHALQDVPELDQTAILLLPSIASIPGEDATTGGIDLGWLSLVPKPFTAAQLTHAVSTAARGCEHEEEGEMDDDSYDVLVVDDDPDSRRVAAKILAEAKLRVRQAPDGESALAEMRRLPPDVVVLDLMMPVLDGFGVLATMRADSTLAAIPVVVLTAKSLTDAERRFLARAAVRVLQKGEHRLADVADLVVRAAERTQSDLRELR